MLWLLSHLPQILMAPLPFVLVSINFWFSFVVNTYLPQLVAMRWDELVVVVLDLEARIPPFLVLSLSGSTFAFSRSRLSLQFQRRRILKNS